MSTSVAIGAAAGAQAAAALAAAENARCTAVLKTYRAETASTLEMQDYAKCVLTVHGSGDPLPYAAALALKVVIVLSLVAAGLGAFRGWADDGPVGAVMFGVLGAVCVWTGAAAIAAIGAGILYVFT